MQKEIKCKECNGIVVVGEIKNGKFYSSEKPLGQIIKNNSNNPIDWNGLCSSCQRKGK